MKINKITEKFEIPEGFINGYYMEIFSGSEMFFSGDSEVKELEERMIKFKCGENLIEIVGEDIKIEQYSASGIRIKGNLKNIAFDKFKE